MIRPNLPIRLVRILFRFPRSLFPALRFTANPALPSLTLVFLIGMAAGNPPIHPTGNPSGTPPRVGNAPAAIPFPAALHVRLGPDSNACGITLPVPEASANARKRKRPLIVWLHGGMGGRNPEKGYESHRALTLFVGPSDYYLCSPSAFLGQEWTRPQGIAHVDALIDYLVSKYPVDAKDITLAGVSDGCLGVIAYSMDGKREIRRRVLISSAPQLVLPLENLSRQTGFAKGTWDFFQGGRDRLFPSDQVVPYLRQWEKTFPGSQLHYYPEGEHDFSFYAEHAADALRKVFATAKPGR